MSFYNIMRQDVDCVHEVIFVICCCCCCRCYLIVQETDLIIVGSRTLVKNRLINDFQSILLKRRVTATVNYNNAVVTLWDYM